MTAKKRLPTGWADLKATLSKTKEITIFVNGEKWAAGKVSGLVSAMPGDGLQIGADTISPVGGYRPDNYFKGLIREVTVEFGE